jgi:membrane-associated phospholipid phosphatase
VFASFVPFAYILRNVRAGRLSDHHVGLREQRRLPLLVGFGSVTVGAALLHMLEAPRDLTATVVAGAAGFAVAAVISHWWKISVHCAVAAGAVTVLALVYGIELVLLSPLVALIAWSRVRLGDHTPAQVIVGSVTGMVVAYAGFTLAG